MSSFDAANWNASPEARAVAVRLEEGLPLTKAPFRALARELGFAEERVLEIAQFLLEAGVIRTFRAFFDFRSFGYAGYLFGATLPDEKKSAGEIAAHLNRMPCVTHSYARNHDLDLWFTAIVEDAASVMTLGTWLRERNVPFVSLAAERRIKLRPAFGGAGGAGAPKITGAKASVSAEAQSLRLTARQMEILRALQSGLAIAERPFLPIAERLGLEEEDLLEALKGLKEAGVLRRIGASLHHVRSGFMANTLMAWDFGDCPESDAAQIAAEVAFRYDWVSHCYLRRLMDCHLVKDWNYRLYVMVHAATPAELAGREETLVRAFGAGAVKSYVSMRTVAEYKKTPFQI